MNIEYNFSNVQIWARIDKRAYLYEYIFYILIKVLKFQ